MSKAKTYAFSSLRLNLSQVVWTIAFILLVFESFLRDIVHVFNYTDEVVTILLMIVALWNLLKRKEVFSFLPQEKRAAFFLGCFVAIGLTGGVLSGVQPAVFPIAVDVFACIKFFVALLSGIVVFHRGSEDVVQACIVIARIVIVIAAVCAAMNLFIDIGMCTTNLRAGIRPFSFVFYHPYVVNVMCAGFVALFATNLKDNRIFIGLALVVMVSTLRAKGIAFVVVALIILLTLGRGRQLSLKAVVLAVVAALIVGAGQLVSYYTDPEAARLQLTLASLEIAGDYLPFGAGFATFGSNITASSDYYSSLYYDYGISDVWGLRPTATQFISDTFFPILLGQCGWLGFVCYMAFLVEVLQGIRIRVSSSSVGSISVLLIVVFLLLSCLSDSAFFSNWAIYLAYCLILCLSCRSDGSMVATDTNL